MSESIEFAVTDDKRFEDLQRVFNQLKMDKDNISDDEQYLSLFDEEARKYFVWSTPEEDALWTDPSLNCGWDFGSMIDAFKNGEFS